MKFLNIIISLFLTSFAMSGISYASNLLTNNDDKSSTIQSVEFLSKEQGAISILDETYEPYFTNLQIREIHALTGFLPPTTNLDEARNFAREKFASAVSTFTDDEKEAILYTISVIKTTLHDNNLEQIADHPWKFIKIEDWLCGGFAHTRGDYIILSQRHIQHLSESWSQKMTETDSVQVVKKLGSLLVHEQFHCLQRKYPQKFESLYVNSWGFEKADVKLDASSLENQLINPDAPNPEWITSYNGSYFWIRTLINSKSVNPQMGKDFVDVVFSLEKNGESFIVAKDSLNNPKITRLNDYTSYVNSFPVTQGLDHPNEISAYMFSVYFVSIFDKSIPFKKVSQKSLFYTQEYLLWLQEYF